MDRQIDGCMDGQCQLISVNSNWKWSKTILLSNKVDHFQVKLRLPIVYPVSFSIKDDGKDGGEGDSDGGGDCEDCGNDGGEDNGDG